MTGLRMVDPGGQKGRTDPGLSGQDSCAVVCSLLVNWRPLASMRVFATDLPSLPSVHHLAS